MSKCLNCGKTLSCGCQKRVLPNGTQGCTNCVGKVQTTTTNETKSTPLNVLGKERYKKI